MLVGSAYLSSIFSASMSIGLPQFYMRMIGLLPTTNITHVRLSSIINHCYPRLLPHRDILIRNIMPIILRHKRSHRYRLIQRRDNVILIPMLEKWSGNAW